MRLYERGASAAFGEETMIRITASVSAAALVALGLVCAARAAELKRIDTIAVPGTPLEGFDISFVDQRSNLYYFADRSNKAVDIFDVKTGALVARVPGFIGQQKSNDTSGPNGVVVAGDELWAGDGDSTVKVVDVKTRKVVDTIATGGTNRVDEMAYSPAAHTVLMANNADDPPFATLASTDAGHKIIAKIPFPDATDGAEQSVFDSASGKFYLSIPEIKGVKANGGVAVIDPKTGNLDKIMPVVGCHPAGLVQGPGNNLLLGCAAGSKNGGLPPEFVVMSTDGTVVKTIPGLGAADMVAYNPKADQYYTASSGMPGGPELGVIDAKTNELVQRIKLPGGSPHSVAASQVNDHVFLPLSAKDGGCGGCIAVYAPN